MAQILLQQRFLTQPQYSAKIAETPLTEGLVSLFTPSSGGVVPIGGVTLVAGQDGVGLRATSPTSYYRASSGKIIAGLSQWTVVAAFRTSQGAISPGRPLYCERAPSGNDILKLECLSADNFALLTLRDDPGNLIQIKNSTDVNDGKFHIAAAVQYSASDHRLFVDGKQAASDGRAFTNSYTDTIESRIGADAGDGVAFFNDPIYFVALYNRALSAEEIAAIWKERWGAFFRSPDRRLFVSAAAPSGDGLGSTSGSANVSGIGASVASASGASSGAATVSGVGSFSAEGGGAGSSSGVATVSGVGASIAASTGSASGSASASGVGSSVAAGSAVGSSSGSAAVSGVGASVAASRGIADGGAVVTGKSPVVASAQDEAFSGGYPVIDHEKRKRKKRLEMGIIEDADHLDKTSKNKEISKKMAVSGTSPKKADLLAQQEALNAELKRLMQIELEREEEEIVRLLMEFA